MAYDNKKQFLDAITPHAMRVAQQTGVDPRLIIAQAAHESAWGSKAPGNNYFGIKSHTRPGGNSLTTTEHVNGQDVRMKQSFRQYNDIGESVDDYGKFLQKNPRYAKVLAGKNLDEQIAAMGASGYATDPNYASKLSRTAKNIALPDGANVQVASATPAASTKTPAQPQMKYEVAVNDRSFGGNVLNQPKGLLAQDAPAPANAPDAKPTASAYASNEPSMLSKAGTAISNALVSPAAAADNPPVPADYRPSGPVNTAADSYRVGNRAFNPVALDPREKEIYSRGAPETLGARARLQDKFSLIDYENSTQGKRAFTPVDSNDWQRRSAVANAYRDTAKDGDYFAWLEAQKRLEAQMRYDGNDPAIAAADSKRAEIEKIRDGQADANRAAAQPAPVVAPAPPAPAATPRVVETARAPQPPVLPPAAQQRAPGILATDPPVRQTPSTPPAAREAPSRQAPSTPAQASAPQQPRVEPMVLGPAARAAGATSIEDLQRWSNTPADRLTPEQRAAASEFNHQNAVAIKGNLVANGIVAPSPNGAPAQQTATPPTPQPAPGGLLAQDTPPAPGPAVTWGDPSAARTVPYAQAMAGQRPPVSPIPQQATVMPAEPQTVGGAPAAIAPTPFEPIPMVPLMKGDRVRMPETMQPMPQQPSVPVTPPTVEAPQMAVGNYDFGRSGLLGDGPQMPQGMNPRTPQGPTVTQVPINQQGGDYNDVFNAPYEPSAAAAAATRDTSNDAILGDSQNMNLPANTDAADKNKWKDAIAGLTDAGGMFAAMNKKRAPLNGIATSASYHMPQVALSQLRPDGFAGGRPFKGLLG